MHKERRVRITPKDPGNAALAKSLEDALNRCVNFHDILKEVKREFGERLNIQRVHRRGTVPSFPQIVQERHREIQRASAANLAALLIGKEEAERLVDAASDEEVADFLQSYARACAEEVKEGETHGR